MFSSLSPITRGTLAFVTAIFFFSLMDAMANHLTESFHPFQVVWARYTFHVVILVLILNRSTLHYLKTNHFWQQMLRSVFVFGATLSFFWSLFYLPLPQTTAIFEIAPILITLGAFLVLGEKIGPWRWAGVFVGFIGALIIIRPGFEAFTWPTLLPMLAATCFAGYALSTRAIGKDESPWTNLLYTALVGMVAVSLVVFFYWIQPTIWEWVKLITLGAIGAFGHFLLIAAFRETEASTLAPWSYMALLFSIIWGLTFFAEVPDLPTMFGAVLIVGAGLVIWWRESRLKAKAA